MADEQWCHTVLKSASFIMFYSFFLFFVCLCIYVFVFCVLCMCHVFCLMGPCGLISNKMMICIHIKCTFYYIISYLLFIGTLCTGL